MLFSVVLVISSVVLILELSVEAGVVAFVDVEVVNSVVLVVEVVWILLVVVDHVVEDEEGDEDIVDLSLATHRTI